jgi:hypothetical protein
MTLRERIARAAHQHERGIITDEEFANYLFDCLAADRNPQTQCAAEIVALIPAGEVQRLVARRIKTALSPGYLRQAFHMSGRRTPEGVHAASLRQTDREKAWAAALRPLLS